MGGGPGAVGGEENPGDLEDEGVADQSRCQDRQGLPHPVDLLEGEEALSGVAGGQEHGAPSDGDGGDQGRRGGDQPGDGAVRAGGAGRGPLVSGGLEGRREAGVEDGGHRYRQHRVGKDVDGLRVLVDGRRTGLSSPAGQGQNHQDAQLLSQDRPYSGPAQAQRPPGL